MCKKCDGNPANNSSCPFTFPDTQFREGQERDLKAALKGIDPSIPLVFVSGNHDLGNTPTPATVEQYCKAWGDDYFSFWVRHYTYRHQVLSYSVNSVQSRRRALPKDHNTVRCCIRMGFGLNGHNN